MHHTTIHVVIAPDNDWGLYLQCCHGVRFAEDRFTLCGLTHPTCLDRDTGETARLPLQCLDMWGPSSPPQCFGAGRGPRLRESPPDSRLEAACKAKEAPEMRVPECARHDDVSSSATQALTLDYRVHRHGWWGDDRGIRPDPFPGEGIAAKLEHGARAPHN